ncbi:EAL domain-containing protein [Pseudomonas lalucatii]|nr:EAL domain-containing protein [Pseudomonas lalucatii]
MPLDPSGARRHLAGGVHPLAEESGLILPLGEFVLERACQQSRAWRQAGHAQVPIAVNVSGHQLNQRQVDRQLFSLLERCDVPAEAIELEITESVLVEQSHVLALLERIRARGVRIAIDDFGTGHSSLSMLKSFPIDILKIDRAFVSEIGDARQTYSIVDTIIALGHALELTLVAEGIETENQLHYLRERGCQLIQGYLTGRPMSADDIEQRFLLPRQVL